MNMDFVDRLVDEASKLMTSADALQRNIEKEAGISFVEREPGFACWQIVGLSGYFGSPREALEAKEKQNA